MFGRAFKTARGKYESSLTLACNDASLLKPGELTVMYRDYIEDAIRRQPDMYLWSHKRFKFEWSEEYRNTWIDINPVEQAIEHQFKTLASFSVLIFFCSFIFPQPPKTFLRL